MKLVIIRFIVAAIAFAAGLTCEVSFGAVISQHKHHTLRAYEAELRGDLRLIRKLLDQYSLDHGGHPPSLYNLVREGYIHELPVDPMTGIGNWDVVRAECQAEIEDCYVIVDIRSASKAVSSEGTPYNEW